MKAELIDFKTGWYGLTMGIDPSEIEDLIVLLRQLKAREIDHFHFRGDFAGTGGVGDVEISLKNAAELNDLTLS